MATTWFDSPLENHLLGIYRFGNEYVLYPRVGGHDWEIIANHEFTHYVLAIATTSGFIHKTFAYLGYQSKSKNKNRWKRLFKQGLHMSRIAHESAATYISLCEVAEKLGTKQAFVENNIPRPYQNYYLILEEVIPGDIPCHLRRLVGRAIASYAFDDPLSASLAIDWNTLIDKKGGALILPRVDERFLLLTQYLKKDGAKFLVEAIGVYDDKAVNMQKSQKEYMIRRRAETYKFERKVRDLLLYRYGDRISSFPYYNTALTAAAGPLLNKLKELFLANGDEGLSDYTRDFTDDEGIDPLFFQRRVVMPNMPLSGLFRINDLDFLHSPHLITITKVVQDSMLSKSLVIKKGEYYTRCYFFDNSDMLRPIYYAISSNFPNKAWSNPNSIILVYVPDSEDFSILPHIDEMFSRPSVSQPLFLMLPGLSSKAFDFLLSTASEWQYEQITLVDFPGICIFVLFHVPTTSYWLIYSDYTITRLFVEEAGSRACHLQNIDLITKFIKFWSLIFLYEGISEGVPVAKQ